VHTFIKKVNTFMGRPPGRIQGQILHMRVSSDFLKAVDKWRAKQEDKPSRSDAIRRLVELGLKAKPKDKSARFQMG
jgi:metal-responsive CopG/Arc/MetJ family transcriptional regulator